MVWIAVVAALAVIGVIAWSFGRRTGRDRSAGESGVPVPVPVAREWESLLDGEDSRIAFLEGVRAYHDKVSPLVLREDAGLVTAVRPPRLISLHLLAGRFAERGQEGLHDPEVTVRELIDACLTTEQPGVLHLRESRPDGGTDSPADSAGGADGGLDGAGGDADGVGVDGMDAVTFAAAVRGVLCPDRPEVSCGTEGSGGWLEVTVAPGGAEPPSTLLLDLGRVLDRHRAAREGRPGMPAEAVLRDVLFDLLAADGPGLTWSRPPSARHRTLLLSGRPAAVERPVAP